MKKLIIKDKTLLEKQLNFLIAQRLTADLVPHKDIEGYLAGVQDVYRELINSNEQMNFNKKISTLLKIEKLKQNETKKM